MRTALYRSRLLRRVLTIPIAIIAAVVILLASPILALVAAAADAATDWKRHRWLRILAMGLVWAGSELVAMVGVLVLWIASGFGLWIEWRPISRAHSWLQLFWVGNLHWGLVRFCGAEFRVSGLPDVANAPAVVLARHVSFLDAVLPTVYLSGSHGHQAFHVLMRPLIFVPLMDIVGHRLPMDFVVRTAASSGEGLDPLREIGSSLSDEAYAVIFPEGGFRTDARFERSIDRLHDRNPALAHRAADLQRVLPPRPNGARALLEGAPRADVVVLAHAGFEDHHSLRDIINDIPLTEPIEVRFERIPHADVPLEPAEFHDWLLAAWEEMDVWITDRFEARSVPS